MKLVGFDGRRTEVDDLADGTRKSETSKPSFLMSTCMFGWYSSLIRGRVTSIASGVTLLISRIMSFRPLKVILLSTACRASNVLAMGSRM